MTDYTVKRLDEMEAFFDGVVTRARASLGVTSWGMQVLDLPPNWDQYPNHNHREDAFEGSAGQEEVYVALAGSATLRVGGSEYTLEPGVFARVGPDEKRQLVPGDEGLRVLCLGGWADRRYEPPAWTELGAAPPSAPVRSD